MKKYSNFFADYHPVIVFIYFISVFVLLITITHPAFLLVSLIVYLFYVLLLIKLKAFLKSLFYMIPMVLFITLINPIFNHYGETPLLYYNGQPITLEATLYGIFVGVLITSLIFLFRAFDRCINSHKFIYLFGKFLPTIALMVTMIMRFIPYLSRKLSIISQTQATLGISIKEGTLKKRIYSGSNILSVLISMSLEGTIDTADSMKARGYQLKGKTHYNTFTYTFRDLTFLSITILFDLLFGIVLIMDTYHYDFNPRMTSFSFTFTNILMLIMYAIFMGLPIIVNILEEARWKFSRRKI